MFIIRPNFYAPEDGAEASTGSTADDELELDASNEEPDDFADIMGDDDANTESETDTVTKTEETSETEPDTDEKEQEPNPQEPAAESSTAEPAPIDINNLTPEQLASIQQQLTTQEEPVQVTEAEQQARDLEQYNSDVSNLTQFYTLNEDERAQLESDPAEALPVLAAKMHYQVVNAVTQGIMQTLPQVIGNYSQQQKQNDTYQQQFFDKWSQLSPEKHMQDVMRIGQVYRSQNPQATFDQFINDVGSQIVVMHGLQNVQPQAQQAAPQQQMLPPDQPGGVSTPAASQQAPVSASNMWEELSSELEEE